MIPPLPFEIWTTILGFVTEAQYLPRTWLNCRRVSHAWKSATETAFMTIYLPQARMYVETAELLELTFSGFSKDLETINFRHRVADQAVPLRMPQELRMRLERQAERAWQKEHERYLTSIADGRPRLLYHIWLMGHVEDPAFPQFEVDVATRSVSFRWKPLLSTMFGEIEFRKWIIRRELLQEDEVGPSAQNKPQSMSAESFWELVAKIEIQVRRARPVQAFWNSDSGFVRMHEWQVSALHAYRAEHGIKLEDEEDWGLFYD